MYAGRIVESGYCKDIFRAPRHPYTIGLLACVPRLDEEEGRKLVPIRGLPPNLISMPATCAFLPRCPYAKDTCRQQPWPELRLVGNQQYIRCYVGAEEKLK
jgi:oligopeptide/dipeptide ABC transporter ATP-binding protein